MQLWKARAMSIAYTQTAIADAAAHEDQPQVTRAEGRLSCALMRDLAIGLDRPKARGYARVPEAARFFRIVENAQADRAVPLLDRGLA
jgi:hypothetical protein